MRLRFSELGNLYEVIIRKLYNMDYKEDESPYEEIKCDDCVAIISFWGWEKLHWIMALFNGIIHTICQTLDS